jgi:hypothetical protein
VLTPLESAVDDGSAPLAKAGEARGSFLSDTQSLAPQTPRGASTGSGLTPPPVTAAEGLVGPHSISSGGIGSSPAKEGLVAAAEGKQLLFSSPTRKLSLCDVVPRNIAGNHFRASLDCAHCFVRTALVPPGEKRALAVDWQPQVAVFEKKERAAGPGGELFNVVLSAGHADGSLRAHGFSPKRGSLDVLPLCALPAHSRAVTSVAVYESLVGPALRRPRLNRPSRIRCSPAAQMAAPRCSCSTASATASTRLRAAPCPSPASRSRSPPTAGWYAPSGA